MTATSTAPTAPTGSATGPQVALRGRRLTYVELFAHPHRPRACTTASGGGCADCCSRDAALQRPFSHLGPPVPHLAPPVPHPGPAGFPPERWQRRYAAPSSTKYQPFAISMPSAGAVRGGRSAEGGGVESRAQCRGPGPVPRAGRSTGRGTPPRDGNARHGAPARPNSSHFAISVTRAGRSPRGGRGTEGGRGAEGGGVGGQQESGTQHPTEMANGMARRASTPYQPFAISRCWRRGRWLRLGRSRGAGAVLRDGRGDEGRQQSGTGTPPRDGKRTVWRSQLDPIPAICHLSILRRGAGGWGGAEGRAVRVGGRGAEGRSSTGTGTPPRDGKRTVWRPSSTAYQPFAISR